MTVRWCSVLAPLKSVFSFLSYFVSSKPIGATAHTIRYYQFVNWTARFSTSRRGWWRCHARWLVDCLRPVMVVASELADRLYTLQHFCGALYFCRPSSAILTICVCILLWLWFARISMVFYHSTGFFLGENSKFLPRFSTRTFCFDFRSIGDFQTLWDFARFKVYELN